MTASWQQSPTGARFVMRALARYPDRIAFRTADQSITYRATLDLIGRMQGVLSGAGVGRGDIVAGLAANRYEAWCAGVACHGLGAATTALHPFGSLHDHLAQISDSGADTLVLDPSYGDRAEELAARASVRTAFTLGPASFGVDVLGAAKDNAASPRDLSRPDDLAMLNYTGGTTGRPKGVQRSHRELTAGSVAILAGFPLPQTPRYVAAAPISHASGMFVAPVLACGGTVDLMAGFDPGAVIRRVRETQANMSLLVPSMIYALLDNSDWEPADVRTLELLVYGASPMSPSRLQEGLDRIGPVFCQLYGQTECFVISALHPDDHRSDQPDLLTSAGHPLPDCDVRMVDPDGREVGPGDRGEICVRAPYAMAGYWRQPDLTASTIRDCWIHTGDIGCMDPEGRLFIVDRKKDMVISGGFNIYPREIEDELAKHPAVAAVGVIGVPDPRWGEAVKAYVTLRPGFDPPEDVLAEWIRSRKGPTHVPKSFEFVGQLPLTPLGKVDKAALRAPWWSSTARGVN
jgi:fatty-acyl-CoA synthase